MQAVYNYKINTTFTGALTSNFRENKVCNVSSYAYCANNPMKFIDPNGDITVWDGHVGIVTGVNEDGSKIKLTHARESGKLAQENPYAIKPSQYRSSTFHGYYHPVNETEDGKVSAINGAKYPSAQTTANERV